MLHAYLSAAAFVMLMFFALSGLLLNHPQWFSPARSDGGPVLIVLKADDLNSALSTEAPGAAISRLIRDETTVIGAFQSAEIDEFEAFLRFSGVKGATDVFIDLETREAEIEISKANVTSIIHDLHRGKDAGLVWKRVIDATAILILAMSVAGLILFFSLRFRLATSLKIMGGTLGAFILIFVFLTP
tara:strand:- start:2059 stop:2619 length:561 start_codon:yes stop_codon:yes gene_type:complete